MRTLLHSLFLFIIAPSLLFSESIDHLNPRWTGEKWKPNRLSLSGLAFQRAFFPQVTQGPGQVHLPKDEAFVLRLSLLSIDSKQEEPILRLWGRVTGDADVVLATLYYRQGKYQWRCPISGKDDSLFDAPFEVEISTKAALNAWNTYDVILNPGAYQQMFGWNTTILSPVDPAKSRKGEIRTARQLTVAAWKIDRIEVVPMKSTWIGAIEILPPDVAPIILSPNIIQTRQ
jgi:hypothetical protein